MQPKSRCQSDQPRIASVGWRQFRCKDKGLVRRRVVTKNLREASLGVGHIDPYRHDRFRARDASTYKQVPDSQRTVSVRMHMAAPSSGSIEYDITDVIEIPSDSGEASIHEEVFATIRIPSNWPTRQSTLAFSDLLSRPCDLAEIIDSVEPPALKLRV